MPWAMLITLCVAAIALGRNWSRFRVIHRDQYADAPLLLLNVVESVAVDMDRSPSSAAGLQRQDLKQLAKFSSTTQEQVTARDQLLDLSSRSRSLIGDSAARKALARQIADSVLSSGSSNPQLQVIDTQEARSLFMDVMPHIIEDAIEAEIIEEQEGDQS